MRILMFGMAVCLTSAVTSAAVTYYWPLTDHDAVEYIAVAQAESDVENAIGERIIDLPEDGEVWHTSLLLHDEWERIDQDRRLVAWFETNSRLASLRAQTVWHIYTESDPIYHERFREAVPILPAVLVQRSDGEVIYKSSGVHLPDRAEKLASSIHGTIRRRCPSPWCGPQPQPEPPPQPHEEQPLPKPEPIPDLSADSKPQTSNLLLAIAVCLTSFAGGLWVQWRRTG